MVSSFRPRLVQIFERLLTGGGVEQLVAVECDRFFQELAQVIVLFGGRLLLGRGRLELHAGFLRQEAQGLGKIPALFLHHIAEDIAALVALPEAAPGAGILEDDKSRGARVGMEGAKSRVVLPRAAQLHRLGDQVYDIDAGLDLIDD